MDPVLCPVLVGREAELAVLTDAVARARMGSGGVAAVVGEAGVGKSRLVGEVTAAAAAEGLRVLTGRAVDSGPPAPFRPLAEALLAGLRDAGPPDAPGLEPFRPALGRLLPDLRGAAPTAADESLVVLGEGVVRLLRILAGAAGAVLVLEDLHWADTETLALVTYLADHLPAAPVLCVVTMRAARTPALTAIRTLAARRSAALVELGRLGPGEVTTVAQACLGPPDLPSEVTDWLRDRADGLPFLVEELLAAALASTALVRRDDAWAFAAPDQPLVPQSFADTVRRRLAVLGADGQAIVRAAAVLGRRFDWTLLPAVTSAAENAVREALRRAVDAQLLTAGPAEELGTYRFPPRADSRRRSRRAAALGASRRGPSRARHRRGDPPGPSRRMVRARGAPQRRGRRRRARRGPPGGGRRTGAVKRRVGHRRAHPGPCPVTGSRRRARSRGRPGADQRASPGRQDRRGRHGWRATPRQPRPAPRAGHRRGAGPSRPGARSRRRDRLAARGPSRRRRQTPRRPHNRRDAPRAGRRTGRALRDRAGPARRRRRLGHERAGRRGARGSGPAGHGGGRLRGAGGPGPAGTCSRLRRGRHGVPWRAPHR